ncbi:uncharacterized protein LOC135313623 [Phalacrocorax carbo]|uniref:uncharacterized protein LOC135313623 n=1 Tax=Phalacrocorax carbo TaxID=9209 RepID=UPI0031195EF4
MDRTNKSVYSQSCFYDEQDGVRDNSLCAVLCSRYFLSLQSRKTDKKTTSAASQEPHDQEKYLQKPIVCLHCSSWCHDAGCSLQALDCGCSAEPPKTVLPHRAEGRGPAARPRPRPGAQAAPSSRPIPPCAPPDCRAVPTALPDRAGQGLLRGREERGDRGRHTAPLPEKARRRAAGRGASERQPEDHAPAPRQNGSPQLWRGAPGPGPGPGPVHRRELGRTGISSPPRRRKRPVLTLTAQPSRRRHSGGSLASSLPGGVELHLVDLLNNTAAPWDLITVYQYLRGSYKEDEDSLFTRSPMERTRGNGHKLLLGRFRLDTRGKFFTVRTVTIGIISPGKGLTRPRWAPSRVGWKGCWAILCRLCSS